MKNIGSKGFHKIFPENMIKSPAKESNESNEEVHLENSNKNLMGSKGILSLPSAKTIKGKEVTYD